MAIKDENIRPTPANAATGFQQPTMPPQPEPARQMPAPMWSFHGAALFGAPIAPGMGSEYLNKLQKALEEAVKDPQMKDSEIAILAVDNTVYTALNYSCLVVCTRSKAFMDIGIGYHTLIVEATGEKPNPIWQSMPGRNQVEILRVTGDAMNDELLKRIKERVRQQYPVGTLIMTDGCVVPTSFNPDDKAAVKRLALNATTAANIEIEVRKPGFQDLNLAMVDKGVDLTCTVQFARQDLEGVVGEPIRSDVLVNFSSKLRQDQSQQASNQMNMGSREARISLLSGFIDTLYAPVAPVTSYNFYQPQQYAVPTQRYVANLVVTDIISHYGYTPAMTLLWLATSIAIRDDNNWVQAFRMTPNTEGVDLHDIGALNIDANLENNQSGFGQRIDTKSDSFQLQQLGQLIASLYRPELLISLDVPECGEQTWYLSIFKEASVGNKHAQDLLLKAANDLTNGNFSRYFGADKPVFINPFNRIHLGYYTDKNGMKKDIRAIDYLAVANFIGDKDPLRIRAWSDTFLRKDIPLEVRLADRKALIDGLTHNNAVFTGFAQRVTFSKDFMDALTRGCVDAGLMCNIQAPATSDFNQQRGVADFVSQGLLTPAVGAGQSFLSHNLGYQASNRGYYSGYSRY